jgi:hypothetical protein
METSPHTSLDTVRWTIAKACPSSWSGDLERCGGGYFHSPAGLLAGAPSGDPLFLQLWDADNVVGVGVAVRRRTRWGLAPPHVYLPSVPAVTARIAPERICAALIALLSADGSSVTMDSFGASSRPGVDLTFTPRVRRNEFLIPLGGTAEELAARCGSHHRRHLRRGERFGWTLRLLPRAEGAPLLLEVQRCAAERGMSRGEPFVQGSRDVALHAVDNIRQPWGLAIFSAWAGDVALAAAVVGYANGHAYYVAGGSTLKGYEHDASIWLHWRIGAALADAGFSSYNLGGVPALASEPSHPMHGLHRFKTGFGSAPVECVGIQCPAARAPFLQRWLPHRLTA